MVVQAWAMTRPWRSIRSGAGPNAVLFKCFQTKKQAALPREVFVGGNLQRWHWRHFGLVDTKFCSSKLQTFSPDGDIG